MSTTTMHPPPTFNTLDPFQRARLIRSTRKLGKVLGTTPMLLEPTETCDLRELLPIGPKSYPASRSNSPSPSLQKSLYKQSRRHGSVFNIPLGTNFSTTSLSSQLSATSVDSATSLRETKGFSSRRTRRADTPPPLILQVNTVPVASNDPRLPSNASSSKNQAPRTPLSASTNVSFLRRRSSSASIATPTPLTPSFRFRAPAIPEMRRKKMEKLAQKLGENIPPELVFTSHLAGSKAEVPSIPAVAPPPAQTRIANPSPPKPTVSTDPTQLRSSSLDAVRSPVEPSTKEVRQRRRRSLSVGNPIAVQLPSAKGNHRWEAPAEWTLGPVPKGAKKNRKSEEEDREEWSAEQYGDVMQQLRALRARK